MIPTPLAHSTAADHRLPQSEDSLARRIAAAFVIYGLLATVLLAVNTPPFQNPDEPAHLLRAAQVADGVLVGSRVMFADPDGRHYLQGGGNYDPAVLRAASAFDSLKNHTDVKVTRGEWASQVHWSNTEVTGMYPNTAVYPPFFYIPSAIGIIVGHMTRATIVQSLMMSRLLTGVAAVAVGATAIGCAGAAAIWLFAILTLPMSLALDASSAQDALMLACSALAVALVVRLQRRPDVANTGILIWLTVALGLTAMARPPYVSLALLPLALSWVTWRRRLLAAAAVVLAVAVWSGITAVTTLTNTGEYYHADPARQISLLLADPLQIIRVAGATLQRDWPSYISGFIGQLGAPDTELPQSYRYAAEAMLATAAIAAALGLNREKVGVRSHFLIIGAILIGAAGVFGIQYLTWTVPGNPVVDGVQGRYFLALALPVAALLPALGGMRFARLHRALVLAVVGFPVVTLAVVMRTVVLRYYLN